MRMDIQLIWLFVLALPVACISWTITHEEVFREPRDFCKQCIDRSRNLFQKKFFYLFTCEYCFSHYVTIFIIAFTNYKLLLADWRGYIIAGFALVWIANVYMSLFGLIRIDIKAERVNVEIKEKVLDREMEKLPEDGVKA